MQISLAQWINQPKFQIKVMNFHEKVKTLQNYFTAGKFKRVIEGCDVLNKKFPNNSFILNLSGMAYQRLDKDYRAINFFELALKADNNNISAMNNLANSLKNTEQYSKAEKIYKKIIPFWSSSKLFSNKIFFIWDKWVIVSSFVGEYL